MAAIAEPFYVPGAVWAAARMHSGAKNIAQAGAFGPEAFRLAKWVCEDQRFYPLSTKLFNKIWAGAYRLNAFYRLKPANIKRRCIPIQKWLVWRLPLCLERLDAWLMPP